MTHSRADGGSVPGIVVIGTSLGGLHALTVVLPALPRNYPRAVVVVQHRMAGFAPMLPELLASRCALAVREAEDKVPLETGVVIIAPADYHLLIDDQSLALDTDVPLRHSRPSIDVLFESAADAFGKRVIAVVLTGASADGARGVQRVKACGGYVIAQDPTGAESPVMPRAAIATGAVDRVLPLSGIGPFLVELAA